ncbi:MAG: gliding motility-associated C-terminal domain-containing protein [Cyclobacteriaceae bacterium]
MRVRYFLLLLIISYGAYAQPYDSRLGRFRMDEIKGCAPLTVVITDPNLLTVGQCTGGAPCDMAWGDGTPGAQNFFTHTYTQPGTYVLSVTYQSMNPRTDDITITVTPNTPPTFDIFTCTGNQVQVRVTDTNYDSYIINYNDATAEVAVPKGASAFNNHTYITPPTLRTVSVRGKDAFADDNCTSTSSNVTVTNALAAPFINLLTVANSTQIDFNLTNSPNTLYGLEIAANTINPGSFQQVQTLHNISTASVSSTSINADNNYYCFRLGAINACNTATLPVYSNIICSANVDLSLQNNQNTLAWSSSAVGVNNFTINRDGGFLGSTGAFSFSDNTVVCNTPYCYQLFTNYINGSQSISLQKCGTAFSNDIPTPIDNVTAVVNNGSVDFIWQQDPAFQASVYTIYRKSGSGNFNSIGTSTTQQFSDDSYSTAGEYCYRINYSDVCNNSSLPGADVCPIRLSGNTNPDNTITLNWSDYSGWAGGVNNYVVEKYDEQGVPLQTFNAGSATTIDDLTNDPTTQLYVYLVRANANGVGLGQAVSNEITIIKEPHLYYPTAFTPNGDNLNDVFTVYAQYVEEFEMKIFNRWGELLFTTKDLEQGWDGKFKGVTQPEGTYAFVAKLTDLAGRTFNRSGSVVLLNKK